MRQRDAAAIPLLLVCALSLAAQQEPDRTFRPPIEEPAYAPGKGPVVCLDEAHANFHTLDNRFWAFGELLRRDGYAVRGIGEKLARSSLAGCQILVISNARPSGGETGADPPRGAPAFTPEEVESTHGWVRGGGKLLLIADHMPAAGAAAPLAAVFGVTFTNGFAVEGFATESEREAAFLKPTIFRTADRTLSSHAIVHGRHEKESVESIRTFMGQGFHAPETAEPLLVLPETFIILLPEEPWQFEPETPRIPAGGWLQGAVMRVGSGRAAFFGEAAMFTAQVAGPERFPAGMNAPGAEQNHQFVLNLMHWLSEIL